MRVVDGVCRFMDCEAEDGVVYLDPSIDHPLYTEAVDTALSLCDPEYGTPFHVKMVLEWDIDSKDKSDIQLHFILLTYWLLLEIVWDY